MVERLEPLHLGDGRLLDVPPAQRVLDKEVPGAVHPAEHARPERQSLAVGGLLGTRAVLNEFIAFTQLGPMKGTLDPRSFTIASFALAGFANFSSVGIQIGGIGALAPNRKGDLARLGFRAMLAGTLANFLSAAIAGILL